MKEDTRALAGEILRGRRACARSARLRGFPCRAQTAHRADLRHGRAVSLTAPLPLPRVPGGSADWPLAPGAESRRAHARDPRRTRRRRGRARGAPRLGRGPGRLTETHASPRLPRVRRLSTRPSTSRSVPAPALPPQGRADRGRVRRGFVRDEPVDRGQVPAQAAAALHPGNRSDRHGASKSRPASRRASRATRCSRCSTGAPMPKRSAPPSTRSTACRDGLDHRQRAAPGHFVRHRLWRPCVAGQPARRRDAAGARRVRARSGLAAVELGKAMGARVIGAGRQRGQVRAGQGPRRRDGHRLQHRRPARMQCARPRRTAAWIASSTRSAAIISMRPCAALAHRGPPRGHRLRLGAHPAGRRPTCCW